MMNHCEPCFTTKAAGEHILFVDDDESLVFLVRGLLERRGYRVSAFTEPQEAIDAVRAAPDEFSLVVSDYIMRGPTGLDVARAVRDIRADLPVVIASGYISEELTSQAGGAGVRQIVIKPNVVSEFIDAIARLPKT